MYTWVFYFVILHNEGAIIQSHRFGLSKRATAQLDSPIPTLKQKLSLHLVVRVGTYVTGVSRAADGACNKTTKRDIAVRPSPSALLFDRGAKLKDLP